jgi:hypothetical protein
MSGFEVSQYALYPKYQTVRFGEDKLPDVLSSMVYIANYLAKINKVDENLPEEKKNKRLTKILKDKEYISAIKFLTTCKDGKFSGSVMEKKLNEKVDDDFKYTPIYRNIKNCVCLHTPFNVSTTKFPTALSLTFSSDEFEEAINIMLGVEKFIKEFSLMVFPLFTKDGIMDINFSYLSMYEVKSDMVYVQIKMGREQRGDKWELTEYPDKGLTFMKNKSIKMNGTRVTGSLGEINRKELHFTKIHELFGKGSTVEGKYRVDWSMANNKLSIKLIICKPDIGVESIKIKATNLVPKESFQALLAKQKLLGLKDEDEDNDEDDEDEDEDKIEDDNE